MTTHTIAAIAVKSTFRGSDAPVNVFFFDADANHLYSEMEDDQEAADALIWRKMDRQGASIIVHDFGGRESIVSPGDPYPERRA